VKGGSELKLEGKVALITGGGTGIGTAIARRFVEEGAKICITGRRQELLEEVANSLPSGRVEVCRGDVSKEMDVSRMVDATLRFGGRFDVLVNNAAISENGPVVDVPVQVWQRVLEVNITGPFLLMKASIPHMIQGGGGSIINIASVGGMRCLPGMPSYCTSKAALIMLTQQVALDYGPQKIRCNAVCPGGIKTAMSEKEFGQFGKLLGIDSERFFEIISTALPLRRFGRPDEITGICTYLASDDSTFTTGSAILVDAGTAVVDVVGASIMAELRKGGLVP
jgi:meso-butanediol dehydrogenase/(S,S)-butanediol dehydrogenase/diacetyl reductase